MNSMKYVDVHIADYIDSGNGKKEKKLSKNNINPDNRNLIVI